MTSHVHAFRGIDLYGLLPQEVGLAIR